MGTVVGTLEMTSEKWDRNLFMVLENPSKQKSDKNLLGMKNGMKFCLGEK